MVISTEVGGSVTLHSMIEKVMSSSVGVGGSVILISIIGKQKSWIIRMSAGLRIP